jgi:hypothetical protein
MQLCIPCFKDDKIYDRCEIIKPKVGIIGNTYEILQEKGEYPAMLEFISGGISSFFCTDNTIIENKEQIRAICRRMPYITAEVIALKIMSLINPDDWIEGVYYCPRCGEKIITGIEYGEDTRDKISDLEIVNMGEDDNEEINIELYNNNIHVDLESHVKIMHAKTDNVLEEIESIDIRFPTIDDCIIGMQKYSNKKDIKRQFAIYSNCIKKINGEDVKIKWRRMWGEYIFDKMDSDDLSVIGKELQKYGIKKSIKRSCRECGKIWDALVNTSNFFVSGLRSV